MCHGEGKIEASILITDEIEHKLVEIVKSSQHKQLELTTHPFLEAYFKKGFFNKPWKWWMKYKTRVKISADPNYHYGEYHFFDENEEEIVL